MLGGQQCAAPIELPHARLGDKLKAVLPGLDGGVNEFSYSVSFWQSVKIREGLFKVHGFQCIGGGSVLPPPSCRTLSQALN